MQTNSSRPSISEGSEKAKSRSVSRQSSKNTSISQSPSVSKLHKAKTMPVSSDSSDSKPVRERKTPSKSTPLHEKKSIKISEMQQQLMELQEDLNREKQEKAQAIEELSEAKKMLSLSKQTSVNSPIKIQSLKDSMNQVEIWEREIEKSKESERRMLESLIFQTKQLEQTKISLEEAKLEIRTLKENNREEEIKINELKIRVKTALESEEKSKKAMDDLAIALNDVSEEAKQVKLWLSETESELQRSKTELETLKDVLANIEAEKEELRVEKEELVSTWNEKESLFISCMKESESEVNKIKAENLKLSESQRIIREENSRLRDILKQAVNEANGVKENLEIERKENSELKRQISEKEKSFQTVKQDYECLKVSERSARDSLKELENMLEANPNPNPNPNPNIKSETKEEEHEPPQNLKNRRHSIGEPSKFNKLNGSDRFDPFGASDRKNNLMYATRSNICDMRETSNAVVQELGGEYDYIDRAHLDGTDQYVRHKKKPILRRFGDIFRRKSVHGANLHATGY